MLILYLKIVNRSTFISDFTDPSKWERNTNHLTAHLCAAQVIENRFTPDSTHRKTIFTAPTSSSSHFRARPASRLDHVYRLSTERSCSEHGREGARASAPELTRFEITVAVEDRDKVMPVGIALLDVTRHRHGCRRL